MKLYTRTVCPKCMMVKSEINSRGIEVELVNIDNDESAKDLIVNKGFMSVPVLEFENEFIGEVPNIMKKLDDIE